MPHWFDGNSKFWYRNELGGGAREFIVVDAESGTRRPAFDHAHVARQLGPDVDPQHLPIQSLQFDTATGRVFLLGSSNAWVLDLNSGRLTTTNINAVGGPAEGLRPLARPRPSERTGNPTTITFVNRLSHPVSFFWVDGDGTEHFYGTVAPGTHYSQHTYAGHVWVVRGEKGDILAAFQAEEIPGVAVIAGEAGRSARDPAARNRERRRQTPGSGSVPSPDAQWTAFVSNYNVFVLRPDGAVTQLSTDGSESNYYDRLEWSPDGRILVAWRVEPAERKLFHLIRYAPPGGGRAQLESRPYALPGDKFPMFELNLFDVQADRHTKPQVDRFEHEWLAPELHWERDGRHFTYWQVDRGHQRARIFEVDSHTGSVRTVMEERSNTFIWTAHTENLGLKLVNWLQSTDEIIYVSERDGWRHLYLIDIKTGHIHQITKGPWVVRGIDFIDEQKRQIWFNASGRNPDQDPYFVHYYRVNFDGSGLVALTEANGTHSVQFSPDRRFIIDTYSRVDLPPVHELRRTSDGALVCRLETADASELYASGWTPPEVFVAKGRDGTTDIWGVIFKPRGFHPSRKYPVVENIYAGPQGSYVPKSFLAVIQPPKLTELGFVVVQIDGMGTANRSKAFHDVCWRNLHDAGFPDRILWHKAAAAKFPWYDITRVGIYGVSAGGQNAAAAVLFHHDFYKVAVAACGCHDNRLDKASWNEQWLGYMPPDRLWRDDPENWYARNSNIENAHLLGGKLMLIVGGLDRNVPPECTLRFVDALIRANKDFELVFVPEAGHGMGGPFGERKMQEFFLRHLLGTARPVWATE